MNYLGEPRAYKYYDERIFLRELRRIDLTLYPESATERQFEEALEQTSRAIFENLAKRSLVDEYRGPQSIVHLTCNERQHFRLDSDVSASTSSDRNKDQAVVWMQCTTCSKWRRIDTQTLRAYSDDRFLAHVRRHRRRLLATELPSIP